MAAVTVVFTAGDDSKNEGKEKKVQK